VATSSPMAALRVWIARIASVGSRDVLPDRLLGLGAAIGRPTNAFKVMGVRSYLVSSPCCLS